MLVALLKYSSHSEISYTEEIHLHYLNLKSIGACYSPVTNAYPALSLGATPPAHSAFENKDGPVFFNHFPSPDRKGRMFMDG